MLSKLFTTFERDQSIVCDTNSCTAQAIWIVSIHQIDRCDKFPLSGCLHFFACPRHADVAKKMTLNRMRDMQALLPGDQVWVRCNVCSKQFGTIDDACKLDALVAL